MEDLLPLGSLFLSAFLAATLLPAQSEAMLAFMGRSGELYGGLPVLIGVATLGNVLGACVNWWLGRYADRFRDRKWFPTRGYEKGMVLYQRWGIWTLLLAWLPVIGDPLTLAAGVFRVRFLYFLPLVTIGKGARYLAVVSIL